MNETHNAGDFWVAVFWAIRCGGIDVMALAVDMGLFEDFGENPYN